MPLKALVKFRKNNQFVAKIKLITCNDKIGGTTSFRELCCMNLVIQIFLFFKQLNRISFDKAYRTKYLHNSLVFSTIDKTETKGK